MLRELHVCLGVLFSTILVSHTDISVNQRRSLRPTALCVFRQGDQILVFRATDPATGEVFYRPFGGEIEFGERAEAAIVREIGEETGESIDAVRLLGVLENFFAYGGEPDHEIVFVFNANFTDRRVTDDVAVQGRDERGNVLPGTWMELSAFGVKHPPLYPDGLLQLLRGNG